MTCAQWHGKTTVFATRPLRRPKPLFTTAKIGAGMSHVTVYVARRVVMRWEWEEAHAMGPILSETVVLFILVAP
jgi:hypothetical protein